MLWERWLSSGWPTTFPQVIVSEQFNYADHAALDVNWNLGANNTLTLNPGTSNASTSVTTRIDLNIDGTWDLSYTENGKVPTAAFSDLRVHSPVASTAGAGGITVDNIVLESCA